MAGGSAWERRNARARALGFRNYYDYRTRGATGERLRAARGHASSADLARALRGGRVATLIQEPEGERNDAGQYRSVKITVQLTNGDQHVYRLRGQALKRGPLDRLRAAAVAGGVDVYLNPSVDVMGLAVSDVPDIDEAEAA